ncbi:MAG: hypothetical protein H6729_03200 [Deltaproteobacteria bacterium]|nr:hypothetical protein [Deltaproteobacteria bacterium]
MMRSPMAIAGILLGAIACASSSSEPEDGSSFDPRMLILEGRTSLPQATIRATIGAQSENEAVEVKASSAGEFRLSLILEDAEALVLLTARGNPSSGEERLEYVSLLDPAGELMAAAGPGGTLTINEDPGLVVGPISTARYAAIVTIPDVGRPTSKSDFAAAELRLGEGLLPWDILPTARLLADIEARKMSLPVGIDTTRALVENLGALEPMLQALEPANLTEVVDAHRDAFVPIRAHELSAYHQDLVLARRGSVGGLGAVYHFSAGARGVVDTIRKSGDGIDGESIGFAWAIAEGRLRILYDRPLAWLTSYLPITTDMISGVEDPDIRAALGRFEGYEVPAETTSLEVVFFPGGDRTRLLGTTAYQRIRLDVLPGAEALTSDKLPGRKLSSSASWRRTDDFPSRPFDSDALVGKSWALPVLVPKGDERLSYEEPSDDASGVRKRVHHAIVSFQAGGNARVDEEDVRWSVESDGRLRLVYETGELEFITFAVLPFDTMASDVGLLAVFELPNGQRFSAYLDAVPLDDDPTSLLSASALETTGADYWQAFLNWWLFSGPKDVVAEEDIFGWQFRNDGGVTKLYPDDPDEEAQDTTLPTILFDHSWRVARNGSDLLIERFSNRSGSSDCLADEDPSCYVYRRRTWQPLRRAGDYVWVLEVEREKEWPYAWDESTSAWVDADGHPEDMNHLVPRFPSRINRLALRRLPPHG